MSQGMRLTFLYGTHILGRIQYISSRHLVEVASRRQANEFETNQVIDRYIELVVNNDK